MDITSLQAIEITEHLAPVILDGLKEMENSSNEIDSRKLVLQLMNAKTRLLNKIESQYELYIQELVAAVLLNHISKNKKYVENPQLSLIKQLFQLINVFI